MKVIENEEYQSASLSKEDKRDLSLIHIRDTKNKKHQEKANFSHRNYHIKDIKYMQDKNVNISWDYTRRG